jgi:glc operon protein GlcG
LIVAGNPLRAVEPATETVPNRPFIARDRVSLQLAGAELAIDAAIAKAEEMKLAVNIAVVDDGGHLLAFARMDGARPGSVATSLTKAVTAATMRRPTGPVGAADKPLDVHLNLSLQNAAAAGGGKVTTLFGGVNIVVDGQTIGAIGVGGGTGEQDAAIATAGVEALQAGLK